MAPSLFPVLRRSTLVARLRNCAPFLLVLAGRSGAQPQDTSVVPAPIPIGVNLKSITPYDRSWVFTDAMKMASPWRYDVKDRGPTLGRMSKDGRKIPDHDEVPLDPRGWPMPTRGRPVSCDFFVGARGRLPAGEYVCKWKGSGSVEFRGANSVVSQSDHRLVVQLDSARGGQPGLIAVSTSTSDPIRDIRVWLPGQEDSCHMFHPEFLEKLRPFSVLRFYPWMRVYSSSGRWANRTTLTSARQGGEEGVAVEVMVDLCNELKADPWFCIPHVADEDYVRNFAQLVRDSLHHDAKIYVELSNEVWNTDFAAGQWARAEARRRGVPAMRVEAEVASRVFKTWLEVFGDQSSRIVRVAGGQLNNPGIANSLCQFLGGEFDAIAVGAYFGARADRDHVDKDSSASQLMTAARANLDTTVLQRIADHRNLADTFSAQLGRHIALLSYEGGQSIVARSPGGGLNVEATLACQQMPEMFDAYRALIEGARTRGLELFVAYDFIGVRNSADTFSLLEYVQQPLEEAPKYRALIQGWESRGQ